MQLISKDNAIEKIKTVLLHDRTGVSALSMIPDKVKAGEIKDSVSSLVFPYINEGLAGWLFIFDKNPQAIEDHPVKYVFIIDKDNYAIREHNRRLNSNFILQSLDWKKQERWFDTKTNRPKQTNGKEFVLCTVIRGNTKQKSIAKYVFKEDLFYDTFTDKPLANVIKFCELS